MSSVLQRLLHNLSLHSLLPSHWDSMAVGVGSGWCMSVLFPEVTFHIQQRMGHYDVKSQSFNPGLQYPHLHGPVHTPDNNRWDTPPV